MTTPASTASLRHTGASYRAKLNYRHDSRPLDEPLISWGQPKGRCPTQYLSPVTPHGQEVAEWQNKFFGIHLGATPLRWHEGPEFDPIRPNAPTIVVIFYPRPDLHNARAVHQPESYLRRLARIAAMGEQTILYIPPTLRGAVRALRADCHWYIIDDYETVWDIPTNDFQRHNFGVTQPALFDSFDGYTDADGELKPVARYNRGHHSAVCNAKAFIMYHAVMRNPFGSDRWMYADAGFLFDDGPCDESGAVWGDLISAGLDERKFDRAIELSRDTGVVMGEYPHDSGIPTLDDECWTSPKRAWKSRQFICQIYVGSSLGMLNHSVRFMRTVDDMDAAGMYTGREELVAAFVALRYPNSVFSVPWFPLPERYNYRWQFPLKFVFSRVGGDESVPPIQDPISALYCKDYIPRQMNLEAGGIYAMTWRRWLDQEFNRRSRPVIDRIRGMLGWK